MRIFYCFLFTAFVFLSSCGNKRKATATEVTPEMCNCFSLLEKEIAIPSLITSLAERDDPDKFLKESIGMLQMSGPSAALDSDIDKLSRADDVKTPSGACLKNMEKKYKGRFDFKNEALANELIAELKKQNCLFAAGMLNWKWRR